MPGFARVNVERRGAGGGEGCGDLARHVPGLAHADADHAAAAGEQEPAGAGKVAVEPGADRVQPAGLDVEDAAAAGGQRCIVDGGCCAGGHLEDRKSVGSGKSVSVRDDLGCLSSMKQKQRTKEQNSILYAS